MSNKVPNKDKLDDQLSEVYDKVDELMNSVLPMCGDDPVMATAVLCVAAGEAAALAGAHLAEATGMVIDSFIKMQQGLKTLPAIGSMGVDFVTKVVDKAIEKEPDLAPRRDELIAKLTGGPAVAPPVAAHNDELQDLLDNIEAKFGKKTPIN